MTWKDTVYARTCLTDKLTERWSFNSPYYLRDGPVNTKGSLRLLSLAAVFRIGNTTRSTVAKEMRTCGGTFVRLRDDVPMLSEKLGVASWRCVTL